MGEVVWLKKKGPGVHTALMRLIEIASDEYGPETVGLILELEAKRIRLKEARKRDEALGKADTSIR